MKLFKAKAPKDEFDVLKKQVEVLEEISSMLISGVPVEDSIDKITKIIPSVLGVYMTTTMFWDPKGEFFTVQKASIPKAIEKVVGLATGGRFIGFKYHPKEPANVFLKSVREKKVSYTKDIFTALLPVLDGKAAKNVDKLARSQIKLLVSAPLILNGEVLGVIALGWASPTISKREIKILSTFANQASIAIYNSRLFNQKENQISQTEARNSQLSLIYDVADLAVSNRDYQGILTNTAEVIIAKDSFDAVLFCVLDETKNKIKTVIGASTIMSREALDQQLEGLEGVEIFDEGSDSLIERSIQEMKPFKTGNIKEVVPNEWASSLKTVLKKFDKERRVVVVPLVGASEAIGSAVFVQKAESSQDTLTVNVNLMETVSQIIGSATETAIAFSQKEVALKLLQAARQREKDMMDIMGHELRTPLSIIRMSLGLLKNKLKTARDIKQASESLNKYVERIDTAVDRESTLLERMLSSTKIDANRMELHLEKLSLSAIIDDAILGVTPVADKKDLIMKFSRPQEDIPVFADKVRLAEVLDNLVGNAVKYTPEGSVSINTTEKRSHMEVVIQDTGFGIPKEAIPHLGEKFYRVGQYTNGKNRKTIAENEAADLSIVRPGGTGLGLYVSFELVKRMGGKIKVDSEVGKGTTFKITIPKYDGQEAVITGDKANKDVFKRMGFTQNDN